MSAADLLRAHHAILTERTEPPHKRAAAAQRVREALPALADLIAEAHGHRERYGASALDEALVAVEEALDG